MAAADRAGALGVELDDPSERLRLVVDRAAPLALARERTLPVLPVLTDLFPGGALRRGSVVGITGIGATSLALAVAAGPSAAGSWTAVVGDGIGLAAAAEAGIALERLLVVSPPERSMWALAVAALVGAVDVVILSPDHRVADRDARRLVSRLRERGSVLSVIGDRWPTGPDVDLRVETSVWSGVGKGHGLLLSRQVTVHAGGRGASARPRRADFLLPGPDGEPGPIAGG